MSYILKQYQDWITDANNYWTDQINNDPDLTDTDKTNLLSQLSDYLTQFQTTVENYKQTFTYPKFKSALITYAFMYQFDSTDIFDRYTQFSRPDVKPFTQIVNYYTYILCDITTAFSIDQETDQNTGTTYYVLNMVDLQTDINNISALNEDDNVISNIIEPLNNCISDIGIVQMFKNLVYYPKKNFVSFEEYCNYKIVCSDFGFKIPYVT
jgi:hypothetical protein